VWFVVFDHVVGEWMEKRTPAPSGSARLCLFVTEHSEQANEVPPSEIDLGAAKFFLEI
jgi:hypothetical protein